MRSTEIPPKRRSIAECVYTYVPEFLDVGAANALFDWLLTNVDWAIERFNMFGRSIPAPRLVAWYGDPGVRYCYSGIDHEATGWPQALAGLVRSIRAEFAPCTNFLLVNRYRSGEDSMGWHTDAEPEIEGRVVTVSLGAVRRFHLRADAGTPSVKLDPGHGSLLIHPRDYPHALPKTRACIGERVSLSFRTVRAQ